LRRGLRVLLADVYWLTPGAAVEGPGYVYISRGVVEAVEPGEPGEEEQEAEMVAGGPGRLVVPGFAYAVLVPEAYPLRGLAAEEGLGALEAVTRMGAEDAYYASLMMLADAALNAYTRLVLAAAEPAAAAKAATDAGLEATVLVPVDPGCPAPLRPRSLEDERRLAAELGADLARIPMEPLACSPGAAPAAWQLDPGSMTLTAPHGAADPLPAAPAAPPSPWSLLAEKGAEAWRLLVKAAHLAAEEGYTPLTGKAHLAVLDLSEPPGWLPSPEAACPRCLGPTTPRVETVLSGGRIVVDGGEHLYIGSEAAAEASRRLTARLRELLGRRGGR